MDADPEAQEITVVRCEGCGDTFPTERLDQAECPSCGSRNLHPATEPLL